ncbi:hypothetical protein GCM10010124_23440 [Pilimelia terevasa]|uniref:Ppx/GppA phosphatase N-terminal domain-containing protein n=1 Tax=Pilimelia terevasa TaxID=53372 RepID=A0A8J3FKT0_9ACTN|nr:Ppx/GppA phosphatase family protein [Pilimelia terevasa]GGK30005.1 hypothetical protein GCM10010124_23440 [Pilimelia terevasa]
MRLGVLDVGSNTVHLVVVDAHRGGHPWPAHSEKTPVRLVERLDATGAVSEDGAAALVEAVGRARAAAEEHRAGELLAFATSALREAGNGPAVLEQVRAETGVDLRVLSGADEARLTFLAVRRWVGWSAGRLLVLDIGGGSLELAAGVDEEPAEALSVPLGAGRLTRQWLGLTPASRTPPDEEAVTRLRAYVEELLAPAVRKLGEAGWDRVVVTSKTFRTLARLSGAAPSSAGLWAPRQLSRTGLRQVLGFVRHIPPAALTQLEGVSPARAHQLLAGAVVAEAALRALRIEVADVCPWALREGVILRRLDRERR